MKPTWDTGPHAEVDQICPGENRSIGDSLKATSCEVEPPPTFGKHLAVAPQGRLIELACKNIVKPLCFKGILIQEAPRPQPSDWRGLTVR